MRVLHFKKTEGNMKWQEIETRNAFWVIKWVNNDSARRAAVPVYFVPHVRVTAR